MDISKYIVNAVNELKQKALGVRDNVLRPVVDASKYLTSPSLKTNLSEKLQTIKTLGERNAEWAVARINDNIVHSPQLQNTINKIKENTASGINQINSKLPFGINVPTSFSELNKRLEEAMGMTPEYKAVQDKIYLHGWKSLTPEEQKIAIDPSLNFAMGATTGIETKGAKLIKESGAVKNLFNKVTSKLEWSDPVEIQKLKNALGEGEGYLSTNKDPLGKVLTPEKRAMIERSIESTKAKIAGVLKSMGGDKSPMEGLFNESQAQSAMRRKAGLSPQDVYQGTLQTIKKSEQAIIQKFGGVVDSFDNVMRNSNTSVKNKINIFDYLRTPDRVLQKIGLGNEAKQLRTAWDGYLEQLPREIERVSNWAKEAPGPQSSQNIFRYLDGTLGKEALQPNELKVATEIKAYFKAWADKLGLPEDKRITNYITHIWEKDSSQEFPSDIASLIRDKVAGSVYDPFVQKRLGGQGYREDVWASLDAYVKRGLRKINLDPVLEKVKTASENFEDSQFKYVKNYIDRVNLRPTDIDNLLDNGLKQIFGYKFGPRPTANITQKARQAVYRGLLGLNPSSALKNLSQGANTYAELGEKYTLLGYTKVAQNLGKFLSGADTELNTVGVLRDGFVQDRALSATKQMLQKSDDALFYMFNMAEKINRGASYFGAKARAIAQGKTEQEAIDIAKDIVRKTQFTFGNVDTPVALQSDIAKTFAQMQQFTIKQGEFLGEKLTNKEWAGIVRYIGANVLFAMSLGKLIGFEPSDMIPSFRFGTPPTLQLPTEIGKTVLNTPDKYGNIPSAKEKVGNIVKAGMNFIPAGGQIKKTLGGIDYVLNDGSYNSNNKLQYPYTGNPINPVLFGKYNNDTAQNYFDNPHPLSDNQTELYKALISSGMTPQVAYDQITSGRGLEQKVQDAIKPEGFNLFGFLKGKQETSTSTEKTGIFKYLNQESQQSEENKIISEVFANTSTPEEAQKALSKLLPGVTYQDAMIQMVKSLNIENRSQYLFEEMQKLSNEEFGKSLQAFIENKIITNSVIDNWAEMGRISDEKAKQLKEYTKLKTGKKLTSGPKFKKLAVGKIRVPKKSVKLKVPTFKPVKVKYKNLT